MKLSKLPPVERVGLSIEETAQAFGIGRTNVFRLIKEGQLKAVKIGRRTVIPTDEVQAFMARLKKGA